MGRAGFEPAMHRPGPAGRSVKRSRGRRVSNPLAGHLGARLSGFHPVLDLRFVPDGKPAAGGRPQVERGRLLPSLALFPPALYREVGVTPRVDPMRACEARMEIDHLSQQRSLADQAAALRSPLFPPGRTPSTSEGPDVYVLPIRLLGPLGGNSYADTTARHDEPDRPCRMRICTAIWLLPKSPSC